MKLVHFKNAIPTSRVISEKEYYDYWSSAEWTKIETKSPYESCRLEKYDSSNEYELVIIYKDNRQLRTRNTWKEQRILRAFSKYLQQDDSYADKRPAFFHGVQYHLDHTSAVFHTEIDGQFVNNQTVGIEVKGGRIKRNELNFFIKKMNIIGLEHLHLFAPSYATDCIVSCPSKISLWSYQLDFESLTNYYNNFSLPEFISQEIGRRHLRFLLQNGRWTSPKRRMTDTAKYSGSQKIIQELFRIYRLPVKIYYSLARVIDPISEFRGKGYPIDQIVLGFDIDADTHQHTITDKSYCQKCVKTSYQKLQKVVTLLDEEQMNYKVLLSGAKGFHVYLLDDHGKVLIGKESDVTSYLDLFHGLVDDFRSTYTKEWDFHRIFKLPGTIDATTGQQICSIDLPKVANNEEIEKIIETNSLQFTDQIQKIK